MGRYVVINSTAVAALEDRTPATAVEYADAGLASFDVGSTDLPAARNLMMNVAVTGLGLGILAGFGKGVCAAIVAGVFILAEILLGLGTVPRFGRRRCVMRSDGGHYGTLKITSIIAY